MARFSAVAHKRWIHRLETRRALDLKKISELQRELQAHCKHMLRESFMRGRMFCEDCGHIQDAAPG